MGVPLRVLNNEYRFDHELCDCHLCELRPQRDSGEVGPAVPPAGWNGLMVVTEYPTGSETRLRLPLLGRNGALFDAVLKSAGLKRSETYITSAVACSGGFVNATKFVEDNPNAIRSCQPRLLTEIEVHRPRVILALGPVALTALTGVIEERVRRIPLHCDVCADKRNLPVWKCSSCKETNHLPHDYPNLITYDACGACGWAHAEGTPLLPRRKKCHVCDGKKTQVETFTAFRETMKHSRTAGGVIHAQKLGFPEGVEYIIPTYHPAALLMKTVTKADKTFGGQFLAAAFQRHMKKAARLLTEQAEPDGSWRIVTEVADLEAYLTANADARYFAADIETDNKEPFSVTDIRCVGIHALGSDETIVVDTRDLPASHPLIRALVDFFCDESKKKCFQNGSYDIQTMWYRWGVETRGWAYDTLIAHHAIAPDEPHHLQHIVFSYTDAAPWKPAKSGADGGPKFDTFEELCEYNARDTRRTCNAMLALETELVKERAEFVHKLDIAKSVVAMRVDRVGLPIDPTKHAYWTQRSIEKRDAALAAMRAIAGPDFNPNSPKQLTAVLYDVNGPCRLVAGRFTNTVGANGERTPSADAAALAPLRGHPFVDALLVYRQWKTVYSNYIVGMPLSADWRLRATWNALGACTGRWSSSPNLMNWLAVDPQDPDSPNMRGMVVAPPGWKITGADLSQAELRAFAALSGDVDLINLCKNADENDKLNPERDPHSSVAAIAFPEYREAFTKMRAAEDAGDEARAKPFRALCKALREVAKMTIYAMLYGAGAMTIHEGIYDKGYNGPPVSVEMVQRVIDAFFTRYPETLKYRARVFADAQRTGYLYDALIGRRRVYPLRDVDATVASNYGIQATVASSMDLSIIELSYLLAKVAPRAQIMAQVHDAIYVLHPEEDTAVVQQALEITMSRELQLAPGAPWMPLPATAKTGDSWDQVS